MNKNKRKFSNSRNRKIWNFQPNWKKREKKKKKDKNRKKERKKN